MSNEELAAQRGLSVKLTVTFFAFLAILPILAFVALRSISESERADQERAWQATRTNTASSVAAWFDTNYKTVLLSVPPPSKPVVHAPISIKPEAVRDVLKMDFDSFTRNLVSSSLRLDGVALFWNKGTQDEPSFEWLGNSGAAEESPGADLEQAVKQGLPVNSTRATGLHETMTVRVSYPFTILGERRAAALFVVTGQEWAPRSHLASGACERWIASTVNLLEREAAMKAKDETLVKELDAWRKQLETAQITDKALLRSLLLETVESQCGRHGLTGLTVFWLGPNSDDDLELLLAWGKGPQTSSPLDRDAARSGNVSYPQGADINQVALPLMKRDLVERTVPRVVAVAHFEVPPPPARSDTAQSLLIGTIAAMTVVLAMLFFYMNQRVSQPLQRLITAMARGTDGDLEPIAESAASGEVSWLAGAFNRMVQKLKLSSDKNQELLSQIQRFNEQLKVRVAQATRELEQRNTELRGANERLFGLQRQLGQQERLAIVGQFAGNLAHELGTPLNAMGGHLELLMSGDTTLPEDVTKRLKLISGQIDRLSGIIQRTLQQMRAPAPQFVSVDLNGLVQGMMTLIQPAAAARGIALRSSLAPNLPRVSGDPGQIEQVLMNLVNNALDAMPGGGSLDVLTASQDGQVCLQVRDSGSGISPEEKAHIFEPFFTTKKSGKGTGLGLAICRAIVKSHHGTIDVESEPGKGSWFTVRFPPEVPLADSGPASAVPVGKR